MLNFFQWLIDILTTFFQFIEGIVRYTIVLTKTVIGTVEIPVILSPLVPTVLWVSMSVIIALGVIKIILGRTSV